MLIESTEKRKTASRANGAKSRGPKTVEGKAIFLKSRKQLPPVEPSDWGPAKRLPADNGFLPARTHQSELNSDLPKRLPPDYVFLTRVA